MSAWGVILLVLGLLALLMLFFAYTLLRYGVYRKLPAFVPGMKKRKADTGTDEQPTPWAAFSEQSREGIAWFDAQSPQTLTLTSFDGLKLYADYLPCPGSDRTILLINGYRSKGGKFDFSNVLKRYYDMGYNLLTCEQRAHGRSEGKYIGFGVPERFDVRDWTKLLVDQFQPNAIFLHGISMGCATVLMATGTELPKQVKGVIADCGYTSAWDICKYQIGEQFHLPVFPLLNITNWLDKLITGYSLSEYSCLRALETNKLPILFIHGGKDTFVPTRMGERNFAACKAEKKWLCVEEAGHGMSFWIEPDRLFGEVEAFLKDK